MKNEEMAKALTNIEFIDKAKKIHGDKYEYLSEYIKSKEKIKILCKKHNYQFFQCPNMHLSGNGCPICGELKKGRSISHDEFIKKSNIVHNNKYTYLTCYQGNKSKLKINCPDHGTFTQIANDHLNGHGCPKCGGTYSNKKDFGKKCKLKHNSIYEYDLSSFENQSSLIRCKCEKHGWFEQIAKVHLKGGRCPKCTKKYRYKDINDFSNHANKVHDFKYRYIGEYINNKTKIKIICPEHGIFEMSPANHLNGKNGCPKCKNKKLRIKRIKEISENKFNGYQVIPNFNPVGCQILDKIAIERNVHIKHAMNGGEYYIKELGYWVDGYDEQNNVVYEFDENYHFNSEGTLNEKDRVRQKEIENYLKCKFIRIKDGTKINEVK